LHNNERVAFLARDIIICYSALYAIVCPSHGWISQNGWSWDRATFTNHHRV